MSLTNDDKNWIKDNFATKDDIKNFATKDDLKNFATKDDLKNFATKDDLKNFATKDDLKNFATKNDIHKAIEDNNQKLFAYMNVTFAKQTDVDEIKAQLPKFDKILDMLDIIIGNQVKDRQDLDIASARLSDHEDRITTLEGK